ncbi:unnamed protein product [Phytophthora fragariaefolia]|uniref:Unnamed protein product n=1 Tax=Phytophthora fragariaefolia TaxID=1490495 RepID=A0A9W6YHX6_9STRA|nr:unnamed protein product [Phytophthora fragariaefolia]
MDRTSSYAKACGYSYWKNMTTGESALAHDVYSMTTCSVRDLAMADGVDSVHGAIFNKGAMLFGQQINGGASLNLDLVYAQGRVTGGDTEALGVQSVFGPIHGIWRNPLCAHV